MKSATLLAVFFSAALAQASDLCRDVRNLNPQPSWYPEVCGSGSRGSAQIGGSYSSFADSFNLNAASIPTIDLPVGVEVISELPRLGDHNHVALVKGFNHVGTALTTSSGDTFFGNGIFNSTGSRLFTQSVSKADQKSINLPTMSFGTAVSLNSFFPETGLNPQLGFDVKYNNSTGHISPGYGLTLATEFLTAGYSYSQDPPAGASPETAFHTVTAGTKLGQFQVEYVFIMSAAPESFTYTDPNGRIGMIKNTHSKLYAHFVVLTTEIAGFVLTAGARSYENYRSEKLFEFHGALRRQISESIGLVAMTGYVRNASSLGLQILF